MTTSTVVVCGAQAASCICDEPPGHLPEPHVCKCGGSWRSTHNGGDFEVVAWPRGPEGPDLS